MRWPSTALVCQKVAPVDMALLPQGLRASARSVMATEASFRQGAALMANGVSQHLLPAVRTRVPPARGVPAVLCAHRIHSRRAWLRNTLRDGFTALPC